MAGRFLARGRYQIWVPASYDRTRKWPAILFLHGAGERGNDGVKQTTVGLGRPLHEGKLDPFALVVFPQCPLRDHWIGEGRHGAMKALEMTEREFNIDRQRISLTGISMGGAGTWMLAAEHPRTWSAIAPICGWVYRPSRLDDLGDPSRKLRGNAYEALARRLDSLPVWIFHGRDDTVVPVAESRAMAAALGANAAYTEFPRTGHNSWDPAYMTTHVVQWLVEQKRRG